MFDIDKQKFGAFVAQLRREKGMTQKEMAQQLFISDKAVSKWETGASIPDTALLVPLSQLLGVTVTELLMCGRAENDKLEADRVEDVVKTAISYSNAQHTAAYKVKSRWHAVYIIALVLCACEMLLAYKCGAIETGMLTCVLFGAVFGGYFCFFVKMTLPSYYDENRINAYSDGFMRMNIPGIAFNNSNWPHIVNAVRTWAVAEMLAYPLLAIMLHMLIQQGMKQAAVYIPLAVTLGGLFIPVYIVGKKYE